MIAFGAPTRATARARHGEACVAPWGARWVELRASVRPGSAVRGVGGPGGWWGPAVPMGGITYISEGCARGARASRALATRWPLRTNPTKPRAAWACLPKPRHVCAGWLQNQENARVRVFDLCSAGQAAGRKASCGLVRGTETSVCIHIFMAQRSLAHPRPRSRVWPTRALSEQSLAHPCPRRTLTRMNLSYMIIN